MATKTVYVCDNPVCQSESTEAEKWFSITNTQNIITIAPFQKEFNVKAFCGFTCAINFVSKSLAALHKAEVQPKEALSPTPLSENDLKVKLIPDSKLSEKKIKEFLYGTTSNES